MTLGRTLLRRHTPSPVRPPASPATAGPVVAARRPAADTFDLEIDPTPRPSAPPTAPADASARPEPLARVRSATLIPSAFDASPSVALPSFDPAADTWFDEPTLDAPEADAPSRGGLTGGAELFLFFGALAAGLVVQGAVWTVAWFLLRLA